MFTKKSNCCNAEIKVEGDTTKYNTCLQCNKPCDEAENKEDDFDYVIGCDWAKTYQILELKNATHRVIHETHFSASAYLLFRSERKFVINEQKFACKIDDETEDGLPFFVGKYKEGKKWIDYRLEIVEIT